MSSSPTTPACPRETRASTPEPSRRRFIQLLLGGSTLLSLGSFFYPVLRYIVPPAATDLGGDTVVAGKVGELQANSAKIFRFGNRPGLLIHTAGGEYRALSATCTHLGCTVQYKADQHRIWCACHNGQFDLSGRNIAGPPPRPLESFEVHQQGEDLVVSRKREA